MDAWHRALHGKEIVVVAYGGFIESFVSLCFLEIVNYLSPGKKLFWLGNNRFASLVEVNGLAQICESDVSKETFANYPVPLFMDRDNHAFFNCLNNYLQVKTWYGANGYKDKRPLFQQILRNTMIPWEMHYLPQLRNPKCSDELSQWAQLNHFHFNQPYVCVFPDRGLSDHQKTSALGWNESQLKAFAAMLRRVGISMIVFTSQSQKYYGVPINCLPVRIDFILNLLPAAAAVLSEEVDLLLVAAVISSAKLISKPLKNEFNLNNNVRFLRHETVIYTDKTLTPLTAFNAVRGDI
ncbi:MAG TPA: hypothetical protein VI423_07475 [Paenisporosarcina sp.]|nr:hypothetical protein [Paenisporosarcina sp.]